MKLSRMVQNIIEEHDLFRKGDGVIVGCSGGPDSMCLLHILMGLRESMDLTLKVVHLEHGFRGEASKQDADYVEAFCKAHGLDCIVYREQVREQAKLAGISEETAGREARYRCFFKEKKALEQQLPNGRVKIAVAHNRNDQAETVLMRIMRGTGLTGLKGMELSREDGIIRPLLTTDRSEIEAYCQEHQLCPRMDHTNEETDYTRNRIRLELIPYMKEHFNENLEEALLRLSRIAAESQDVIRREAELRRSELSLQKDSVSETLMRKGLFLLSDGVRHEVMRWILQDLGLAMNVSSVHLEQIDRLLENGQASGMVELPQGYRVTVSYDTVTYQAPRGEDASEEKTSELVPGVLDVAVTRREDYGDPAVIRTLPSHIRCFDGEKVAKALGCDVDDIDGTKLTLRYRKAGDFIRPLGSPGRKKLQDWFVDRKIPRDLRDKTPLVCIGSEVLWVVGHQISENYKVEEQGKPIVFVEFHQ